MLPTLIFILFSFLSPSENHDFDSDKISWDAQQPLEWSDFQGKPKSNSSLDAYTMLGLSVEVIAQKNGDVEMGVFGYFEKSKSWVKPSEKTTALLNHEQRHFDLCEIFRRKLVQKLEAQNPIDAKKFSEVVGDAFNKIFKAYTEEQKRYDDETHHSQIEKAQKKWDDFIQAELKNLEQFSKVAASLKLK